jgi:hypothetical protein
MYYLISSSEQVSKVSTTIIPILEMREVRPTVDMKLIP